MPTRPACQTVQVHSPKRKPGRSLDEVSAEIKALDQRVEGVLNRVKAEDESAWRRKAQHASTSAALDEILRGYMVSRRVGYGEAYRRLVENS